MREGLVGLRGLVDLVALADRVPLALIRVHDFRGQGLAHRHTLAGIGETHDPAHRQRSLPVGRDFQRNLIRGTTHTAGLDLETRLGVVHGALKDIHGAGVGHLLAERVEGSVYDPLGDALLAALHDGVDEPADELAVEAAVRGDFAFDCLATTRHGGEWGGGLSGFLGILRALDAVFGAADSALLDAGGIECAADNVVTHTGQVLHAAAAHEHDRVFLQVVAFVRDVGDDFVAVGEADLRDLAERGVRLLGGAGHDLHADAAAEGSAFERGRLGLVANAATALADELVNGGH